MLSPTLGQGNTSQRRPFTLYGVSTHIGLPRQQRKGGDQVSHCLTLRSPVSATLILASAEIGA